MKEEKNKKIKFPKNIDVSEWTTCKSTGQMLRKAQRDGVETAFDRASNMKPCPIGAKSACCKHCAMGPCRLNAKDPYGKVGVCGATIDTIQSRNFCHAWWRPALLPIQAMGGTCSTCSRASWRAKSRIMPSRTSTS